MSKEPNIGDTNRDGHYWNGFEYINREQFSAQFGIDLQLVPEGASVAFNTAYESNPGPDSLAYLETSKLFVELLRRIEAPTGQTRNGLREGLQETPHRVTKAFDHWFSGYEQDPAEVLKVFEDGAEGYDQMVTVVNIPVYSKCEHHMADIFGTATVAYIPNGRIVGLSKISRVVNIFARRLQVQERLTNQIADCINTHLKPKGVGVLIKARHMCMESRGICQQGHHTVTTALRGVILSENSARAEFMALAR